MQGKAKDYIKTAEQFVRRLRDPRFAGQMLFVVLVLLISWSGVKAIQTNYDLQKQISTLKQQNQVKQLQDNNLKLQNEYYQSDQYLELAARQNFGLGLPGETEITVPKSVALAHTIPMPDNSSEKPSKTKQQPIYQHNFESWVDFFLHRQTSN